MSATDTSCKARRTRALWTGAVLGGIGGALSAVVARSDDRARGYRGKYDPTPIYIGGLIGALLGATAGYVAFGAGNQGSCEAA